MFGFYQTDFEEIFDIGIGNEPLSEAAIAMLWKHQIMFVTLLSTA